MTIEASYSFVDRLDDLDPPSGWSIEAIPGGWRYVCIEGPAELTIHRFPPAENVTVTAQTGDSVTQSGSTAVVEREP